MSIFDDERKQLGISLSGNSGTEKADSNNGESIFAEERRKLFTPPTIGDKINAGTLPSFDISSTPLYNTVQDDFKNQYRQQLDTMQSEDNPSHFETDRNAMLGVKARNLPVIGSLLKGIDSITTNPVVDKAADIARSFYLPGAGLANTASFIGSAENGLARLAPKLADTTVGRGITQMVSPGVPFGVGGVMQNNSNPTGKDLAIGGIEGATFGAGLGVLGKGIGSGLSAIADKYAGTKVGDALGRMMGRGSQSAEPAEQATQDILALPQGRGESRYNAAMNRSNLMPNDSPIMGTGNVKPYEPLGLPEPNIGSPTRARVEVKPNEYTQKLENLFNTANTMKFTPGRELEELESLWSQIAGPKDPSLDKLIDLAYPKQVSKVAADSLSKARNLQQSREVAGVPNKVRSMSDRYQSVVNEAVSPRQRLGFANQQNATEAEIIPPQRRFAPNESAVTPPNNTSVPLQDNFIQSRPLPMSEVLPRSEPIPRSVVPTQRERGFTETLRTSDKAQQGLKDRLKSAYEPISNETSVQQANKRVGNDLESAASYVLGKSPMSAEKVTTAHRLIDEFSKQGNFERANDIADRVAQELTKAGQTVQAASIYNRLTPEGVLVHAQRIAKQVNDRLPITAKEVKVTPDMAAKLTDLTQTAQKMTGVKDLSNDVLNILDRAKSGEKLSDTDTETLKKFVNESKQFIQETKPKANADKPPRAPQQTKDNRVRDNVVSFMDAQEQAAKERLRARGIRISSTPIDIWVDYAIIGAAKMAKGTIKFADWSEHMIKDLGEDIRPHLRNLYDRSREAFEQSTKKVTSQTISEAEKITNKFVKDALAGNKIDQSQADSLRTLAVNVSKLSGEAKTVASQDLQKILQELNRSGFLKKVSTAQTIGQLLNPKTQVRNILGNEMFYRLERLNKLIATPIDIARSNITGGQRTVTFKTNNQGEFWKNWLNGAKAGWNGTNINGLQTQYDLAGQAFTSKYNPLTYMEKALGASLRSFDNAAYMRAYNNSLGEQATLRAINEGESGNSTLIQKYIREADDNMMKIADEYGRYNTFQDNNPISKGLVGLKKALNLKQDFGIGDLVLKYPKTPGALLMRALEYSPAGFLRSAAILARPIFRKEPNTAEVTQALSRAIVGTAGLTGLGLFLLDKGVLTGAASKDKDVRDLQRSAGEGQYQVNLSALFRLVKSGWDSKAATLKQGDELYSYDWAQPLAMSLSMGANIGKNMLDGNQKLSGLAGSAYNSIEGGLGTLTEQSVLSGIKNAAQGYPGQTVTDKIMSVLSGLPSSFVPTYLNQAKQLTDNVKRETYAPGIMNQSINQAKAKIPGLAGNLPQQFDTLGRPKETYQNNSLFNVLINPGTSTKYELSPEAKMIVDLINESGEESVAPRVPGKTITVDGVKVKLNGDQFARLEQLQGEGANKGIDKRDITSGTIKSRVDKANSILSDAGATARNQLVKEFPELKPPKRATR